MEAYIIEAQSVVWDSTSDALVLVKDSADAKEVKTSNDTLSNVGPKVSVFNTAKKTFVYWYVKTAKKLIFWRMSYDGIGSDQYSGSDRIFADR